MTHHAACDIPDCGLNRCTDCGDRMTCLGPEPRACLTVCVDCPCDCETCIHVAQDMRDDLLHKIEKEAS